MVALFSLAAFLNKPDPLLKAQYPELSPGLPAKMWFLLYALVLIVFMAFHLADYPGHFVEVDAR